MMSGPPESENIVNAPHWGSGIVAIEERSKPKARRALAPFLVALASLVVLFHRRLADFGVFALHSDLYSHTLLIPFVCAYLAWPRLKEARLQLGRESILGGIGIATLAITLLVALGHAQGRGVDFARQDALAYFMGAFLLLALGLFTLFFGWGGVRCAAGPLMLLVFTLPFPIAVEHGIETFFQHASAEAAAVLFSLSGTAVYREKLVFHLSNITLEVARECSGIRSSLILFITAFIAGLLFLRNRFYRAALVLFVVPLGILRNGLRICVIGMLCVHVDPAMIHSWVHRKGGPLFFALSLIPFFGLLIWLRKLDEHQRSVNASTRPDVRN